MVLPVRFVWTYFFGDELFSLVFVVCVFVNDVNVYCLLGLIIR